MGSFSCFSSAVIIGLLGSDCNRSDCEETRCGGTGGTLRGTTSIECLRTCAYSVVVVVDVVLLLVVVAFSLLDAVELSSAMELFVVDVCESIEPRFSLSAGCSTGCCLALVGTFPTNADALLRIGLLGCC